MMKQSEEQKVRSGIEGICNLFPGYKELIPTWIGEHQYPIAPALLGVENEDLRFTFSREHKVFDPYNMVAASHKWEIWTVDVTAMLCLEGELAKQYKADTLWSRVAQIRIHKLDGIPENLIAATDQLCSDLPNAICWLSEQTEAEEYPGARKDGIYDTFYVQQFTIEPLWRGYFSPSFILAISLKEMEADFQTVVCRVSPIEGSKRRTVEREKEALIRLWRRCNLNVAGACDHGKGNYLWNPHWRIPKPVVDAIKRRAASNA